MDQAQLDADAAAVAGAQDKLNSDTAAVTADTAALNDAQAKLAADQAQFDADQKAAADAAAAAAAQAAASAATDSTSTAASNDAPVPAIQSLASVFNDIEAEIEKIGGGLVDSLRGLVEKAKSLAGVQ